MPDAKAESLDEDNGAILQLKVCLLDVSPMVWRRVVVPAAMTLKELHGVFQVVLGWHSLHLYRFRIHAVHYGSWELGAENPDRTLCSFNFRRGDKFVYEYDMTDDWKHEIRIEAWLEPQPRKDYPTCIGGRGDCPPEVTTSTVSKRSASMPTKTSTPWSRFSIASCCRISHICCKMPKSAGSLRMLWSETAPASRSGQVGSTGAQ